MVTLPPGFDAAALVSDLSALGVYVVGAYLVIMSLNIVVNWVLGRR